MSQERRRAISIRQPYVELILQREKAREYRSRPTTFRGTVLLYASKKLAHEDYPGVYNLPLGRIVGQVDIVGCRPWCGEYAYELANPVRFDEPLPFRGQPQPLFWFPELD
jgi:hypothetical protein